MSSVIASYAVVTSDVHGTILSVNQNVTRLFGYPAEELLGENVSILMPSPYREQHDRYIERYITSKKPRVLGRSREVEGKHRDGRRLALTLTLSEAESGRGLVFIAMFEKSRDRTATFWMKEDGAISNVAGNYYYLFGFTRAELIGQNINKLMPEPHKTQHQRYVQKYMDTGVATVINRERNLKAMHKARREPFEISLHVSEEQVEVEKEDGTVQVERQFKGIITPVEDLDAIITVNPMGIIISVSEDFLFLFGYNKEEVIGENIAMLVKGNIKEITGTRAFGDGSITRKVVGLHKDGSVFTATIEIESFASDKIPASVAGVEEGGSSSGAAPAPKEEEAQSSDGAGSSHSDSGVEEGTNKAKLFMCKITRCGGKKADKEIITEGQYMGHYTYGKTLGSGYFGKVRMAIHRLTGEKVAIKTLRKKQYESVKMEFPPREVKVLKVLTHPYINQIYDTVVLHDRVHLILEFVEGRELCEIVETTNVPENVCRHLFRQILVAVEYMHAKGVVHRDLKLENIIVDKHGNAKIIDLGFGNFFFGPNHLLKTFCGSPDYAAPELFLGKPYLGVQADIWSLGVMLFAMLSGFLPFKNTNYILEGNYFFPDNIPADARDLISMILKVNPAERPPLDQILNHRWVCEGYDGRPAQIEVRYDAIDPVLLGKMESIGLSPVAVQDAIRNGEYNEFTTTYFLLKKKYEREQLLAASSSPAPHAAAPAAPAAGDASGDKGKGTKKTNSKKLRNKSDECTLL